jgi:hypothetical protein
LHRFDKSPIYADFFAELLGCTCEVTEVEEEEK